jgi:hypothetical protein
MPGNNCVEAEPCRHRGMRLDNERKPLDRIALTPFSAALVGTRRCWRHAREDRR